MNSAATIELLLRHERFARSVARNLARDGEVDDLVQEAWIAALGAPPRRAEAALAWLERTLFNIASKWRRSNSRRSTREEAVARGEHVDAADELVERLELERRVVEAVLALDEPYKSAIVLRFYEELGPSEIAAKLGVPLETVRSRLKRAQEELRRALAADPRTARERWLSALVAIGAIRAPRTATRASLAASTGTLGVLFMNSKLVLVIAIGVVCAAVWLSSSQSNGALVRVANSPRSSSTSSVESANPTADLQDAAQLATPDAPLVAATVDGERAPIAVAANAAGEPESGHLIVRALDAGTREPIANFELRLANEHRFAALAAHSGELYRASVGNYTALVSAPGYDRATVATVRVESGKTTELNDVVLQRGSGRIAVGVAGLDASSERKFEVELIGDGRGRCEACVQEATQIASFATARSIERLTRFAQSESRDDFAASANAVNLTLPIASRARVFTTDFANGSSPRCEHCGFAPNASTAELGASRSFTFANLVAGPYALRLTENGRIIGEPRRVEVSAGALRSVVFDLTATRAIDVALVDRDGNPLSGELAASAGAKGVELEFLRDEACFSKLWFDARPTASRGASTELDSWREASARDSFELATAVLTAEIDRSSELLTTKYTVRSSLLDSLFATSQSSPPAEPLIDHARSADDELEPALAPPHFDATSASARLDALGIAHVGSLPTASFRVRATCGAWSGEIVVPSAWNDSRVELVLRQSERTDESGVVDRFDASFGEH